jgi:hypothetical protein
MVGLPYANKDAPDLKEKMQVYIYLIIKNKIKIFYIPVFINTSRIIIIIGTSIL